MAGSSKGSRTWYGKSKPPPKPKSWWEAATSGAGSAYNWAFEKDQKGIIGWGSRRKKQVSGWLGKSEAPMAKQWADWGIAQSSNALSAGSKFLQSAWGSNPSTAVTQQPQSTSAVGSKRRWWSKKSTDPSAGNSGQIAAPAPAPIPSRVIWGQQSIAPSQITTTQSMSVPSVDHIPYQPSMAAPMPMPVPTTVSSAPPPSAPPMPPPSMASYTQPSHSHPASSTQEQTIYTQEPVSANQPPMPHLQYDPQQPSYPMSPPPSPPHPPSSFPQYFHPPTRQRPYADFMPPRQPPSPPPESTYHSATYTHPIFPSPPSGHDRPYDHPPHWRPSSSSPPEFDSINYQPHMPPLQEYSYAQSSHRRENQAPHTRADWDRQHMRPSAPWMPSMIEEDIRTSRPSMPHGPGPMARPRMPAGYNIHIDDSDIDDTGFFPSHSSVQRSYHPAPPSIRSISRPGDDLYDTQYETDQDVDEEESRHQDTFRGAPPVRMSRSRAPRSTTEAVDTVRISRSSIQPTHIASRSGRRLPSRASSADSGYYSTDGDDQEKRRSEDPIATSIRRPMRSTKAAAFLARRGANLQ